MAFVCEGADAWERMSETLADRPGAADGHAEEEERALLAQKENVRVTLRHVSTAKLKTALLTTAVHLARCGGERMAGVTASGVRKLTRRELLDTIVALIGRTEDESQMLAIAIEHVLH